MKTEKSTIRKINRSFQVTLPKGFRDKFALHVGDFLEVVEENDSVIIRPVEIQRKQAVEKLKEILLKPVDDKLSRLSEEEVMKIVNEEIKQYRAEKAKKGKKH